MKRVGLPNLPVSRAPWNSYEKILNVKLNEILSTFRSRINALISDQDDVWDDLRFPSQGINPAGTAAPPTVDATTRPGTLLFAHNADNHIAGVAQMPHAWSVGTAIAPHVHWCKTTTDANNVVWEWRYSVAWIGETFPAYSAWTPATNVAPHSNTVDKHALDSFPQVDMTGKKESVVILWEVRRNTAATGDTYAASARLLEFDIHYQTNKNGTTFEIPT